MPTPTYELIETTTLTSSASSVSFSSITQDYRDLVLVVDATHNSTGALYPFLQFNSDTGTNYNWVVAEGDGGSATSSSSSSTGQVLFSNFDASLSNTTPNQIVIQIMDYSATDKHTSVVFRSNNASLVTSMGAARYASTTAITTVTLDILGSAEYATGSTFSIYGIAS